MSQEANGPDVAANRNILPSIKNPSTVANTNYAHLKFNSQHLKLSPRGLMTFDEVTPTLNFTIKKSSRRYNEQL